MALEDRPAVDRKYPFVFECRRSGNCCSRPEGILRLDAKDIHRISRHLQMSESGFRSRYLRPGSGLVLDGLGGRCPFLVDGQKAVCGIYAVRPEKCKTWPFWPELLESSRLRAEAMRLCPGIRAIED